MYGPPTVFKASEINSRIRNNYSTDPVLFITELRFVFQRVCMNACFLSEVKALFSIGLRVLFH